jgi:hypothetical protein
MMFKNLFLTAAVLALSSVPAFAQDKGVAPPPAVPGMHLSTPVFKDGGIIPDKFTQADPNPVSPHLEWSNVPAGVQSFALIFHDPDGAPNKGSEDVLHWLIFDMPSDVRSLPGSVPGTPILPNGSVQAKNRRDATGYMGPGNPATNPYHHYTFELFALDTKLSLGPQATRAEVLKAMDGHVVSKAALVGLFRRPK